MMPAPHVATDGDRAALDLALGSARAGTDERRRLHLVREYWGFHLPSGPITQATVARMGEFIGRGARDSRVLSVAAEIRRQAASEPTPTNEVMRTWWWVKTHARFKHHDRQICEMTGECDGPGNYQLLIEPAALLRLPRMEGDCAVFTMLVLAILRALGYAELRIVTVQADRRRPDEYTHVYGAAYLEDCQLWCPLDASHMNAPGEAVPARDVARKTEWDLSGAVVADQKTPLAAPAPSPDRTSGSGLGEYIEAVRGMGQAPTALSTASGPNLKLLALGGAVLGGLFFLPGWSKLLVPAGLVGAMVVGNLQTCRQIAAESATQVIDETTGKPLASNVPTSYGSYSEGCPTGHTCRIQPPASNPPPQLSCLLNPFPGGL